MSIETDQDLVGLKAAGVVVRDALAAMRAAAAPGVTTGELDEVGGQVFKAAGARSAQANSSFARSDTRPTGTVIAASAM